MLRPLALACLFACFAPLASAQTFTVGPGGTFAEITDALASPLVTDGATLEIEFGTYQSFELTKDLTLVAEYARVPSIHVNGVDRFELHGFLASRLRIEDVAQEGLVSDCHIATLGYFFGQSAVWPSTNSNTEIENATNLLVQRSTLMGLPGCYPDGSEFPGHAVAVTGSTVTIVDSHIEGGPNFDDFALCSSKFPVARYGLQALGGSVVDVVATDLIGTSIDPSTGLPGIRAVQSMVEVRGTASNSVSGGPTLAVDADVNSTVSISGAALVPSTLPPQTILVSPTLPFLVVEGDVTPGGALELRHHAAVGTAVVTGFSPKPMAAPTPLFDGQLWVDFGALGGLFTLAGAGNDTPVILNPTMPANPALLGQTFVAQSAAFDGTEWRMANPFIGRVQ